MTCPECAAFGQTSDEIQGHTTALKMSTGWRFSTRMSCTAGHVWLRIVRSDSTEDVAA